MKIVDSNPKIPTDPATHIATVRIDFTDGPNKGLTVVARCHAVDLVLDCDGAENDAVLAICADSTRFSVVP